MHFNQHLFLSFSEEGMSQLKDTDVGAGDMSDWMAAIYDAKMKKAAAELEEKVSDFFKYDAPSIVQNLDGRLTKERVNMTSHYLASDL